ncbi:MAG: DUF58 domain-containing protein [Polyangiales bacterium]
MSRVRKMLVWIRAAARTAVDLFPLTPLGLLVLGGCAIALFSYGIRRIDLVLLVMGSVGLALGALSVLISSATALAVYLALRKRTGGETLRLECGYPTRTGFSFSSLWFVPFVKVRWDWVNPEAKVNLVALRRRLHEEIIPARRGLYDAIVRRVEVSDAFGLTRVAFKVTEHRTLRLAPSMGSLKQMHVVRSIAGGDNVSHPAGPPEGERADMRHYAPGDPIKFVLWKVYARTRQLVVRTPERAISPVRQTVAYLVAGDGDEPAAGAARVAVDSGALGTEWVLGADGNEGLAKTAPQALEILAKSAHATSEQQGAGLGRFLNAATPGGGAVGRAVVFVPATAGPWLDRVLAAVRARSSPNQAVSPVEFVVCADGISRKPKPSLLARLALTPEERAAQGPVHASDVAKVVSALSSARARVLIVDRTAGRVYAEGHQRALEASAS